MCCGYNDEGNVLMSVKVFILQVAVLNNYEHLVKILLENGADPNIQNQVRTSYKQNKTAVESHLCLFLFLLMNFR